MGRDPRSRSGRIPRNRSEGVLRKRSSANFTYNKVRRNGYNKNIYFKSPYKNIIVQHEIKVKAPIYSMKTPSLFHQLEDAHNIPVPSYSTLTLDEIIEKLKLRNEIILVETLSSLCGLIEANPQLFEDEFTDRILPLIGELLTMEENTGDGFIFILNKVFHAIFNLPVMTILGIFDKLCEYILNGLSNKQSKMKVLSLHILQQYVFPRCPAAMNQNLYYKYLDFLSRDCIVGNVNIDVIRAALLTLPYFLDIYLRNNDGATDEYVEIEIRDGYLSVLSRDPEIDIDYTFGGTVFYDIPQWYPTNTQNGIAVLGLCCFKFLARIIAIEGFPLINHFVYMADSFDSINRIIKRYVTDNNIQTGRYGNAFVNLTKKLGFMIAASKNKLLSPKLRELHEI